MIPLAAFDARQVDARKKHDEVSGTDLHSRLSVGRFRKAIGPTFKPLVPYRVAVLLPEQQLNAIGRLVAKNENVSREGISPESIPHQGGQRIERFSEVRRLLYFPRLSELSCREREQPLGDGSDFLGGHPRAYNGTNLLDQ